MLVSRFMTRRPVTVAPDLALEEATALMERHGFRHLPVVAGQEVVGILSDRDLRLGTGGHSLSALGLPADAGLPRTVREIMRTPVVCVESDERGPLAARHMIEQRIGALPVLEDGQLVGIVTETNLVSAFRDLCRDPAHADELDRPVEEVMHSPVITLEPGDTLGDAIARCHDWRIRHIPVLQDETLVGIVSDRDIRLALGRALVADALAARRGGTARDPDRIDGIMSRQVVSIEPSETISRAATAMLSHHVSALPVQLDGMLLGIITRTDILEHYGTVA
ncbi:MAG TPA: CBS domain-containing protein [Planctomycetota bacterium]|nr:CBS domain-containing protein [Planctomycetota bacterium]